MDTINRLPESQFYDLIRLGFISENYRYSYNRIWVETDENDRFRGKGIASRLMELASKLAKKHGYKKVSLNVHLENPRAQQLYLRKAFKTTNSMTIGDRVYDHMVKEV